MSVSRLAYAFDIADILSSSVESNGTILLQTGSLIGADVRSDGTEFWFPSGYVARPAKCTPVADPTDAPQGLCLVRGDQDICFATRDVRANPLVESLGFGEVQIYAGGPNNTGISKIVLNNDGNGTQKATITVNNTKVEVLSNGTVNISGTAINLSNASDFAALASKVDSNFSALKQAISAATAGGNPVVWSVPSTPSVAASNVKIS